MNSVCVGGDLMYYRVEERVGFDLRCHFLSQKSHCLWRNPICTEVCISPHRTSAEGFMMLMHDSCRCQLSFWYERCGSRRSLRQSTKLCRDDSGPEEVSYLCSAVLSFITCGESDGSTHTYIPMCIDMCCYRPENVRNWICLCAVTPVYDIPVSIGPISLPFEHMKACHKLWPRKWS